MFSEARRPLTIEALSDLEMGGNKLELYPGPKQEVRAVVLFPEWHLGETVLETGAEIPEGIRDWHRQLFLDAERLVTSYKVQRVILEADTGPTLLQKHRPGLTRTKDVEKMIRKEKSVAEQSGRKVNEDVMEWLRIGLDPDLDIKARRNGAEALLGRISATRLLEAVYGQEPELEFKGLEDPIHHKNRGAIDAKLQGFLRALERNQAQVPFRGQSIKILQLLDLALKGDEEAKAHYNWVRDVHLVEEYLEPTTRIAINECNEKVSRKVATLPGDSLMFYGSYHAADMIERLQRSRTVALRASVPTKLTEAMVDYQGPQDLFTAEGHTRRAKLLLPPFEKIQETMAKLKSL